VHGGALGSIVGEVPLSVRHDARHGRDDDHAGGELLWALVLAGLEEGEEGHGGEVDGRDVGVEDIKPFFLVLGEELFFQLFRIFALGVALGAGNTGVCDEEVDALLLLGDLFDEGFEVGFLGDITWPDASKRLVINLNSKAM
jgi:hypothetical protein